MDLSNVSPGAAVMAVAQQATGVQREVAVLKMAQSAEKQQAAALVSLIQTGSNPDVGRNLSVYA
jgi:hypothetical protein